MFVGEVRRATSGCGTSWKLSAGRSWISGPDEPLEVSPGPPRDPAKLARLLRRRARGRGLARGQADPPRDQGRQRARATRKGAAYVHAPSPETATSTPRPPAEHDAPPHAAIEARRPPDRARGAPARPGTHSSRCRRVTRQPPQRARDRVDAKPRRVREKDDAQRRPARGRWRDPRRRPRRKLRLATPRRFGKKAREEGQERREREDARERRRSTTRRRRPGRHQAARSVASVAGAERLRRRLSIIFQRPISGIARAARGSRRGPRPEDPGQQLPVAADPAMLARGRHLVVAREPLEELDVGDEPGPGEEALEEIVGELRVLRHAVVERALERVHVVDPLARVDPLAEEVLVHVGHREGIGVDAARAREDELEERAPARLGQGGSHARLEDRVPFHDARPRRDRRRADSADARSFRPAGAPPRAAGGCRRRA